MNASLSPDAGRKGRTLAGVCLGVLMFSLDGSIVNVAVPTFLRTFNCDLSVVQWTIVGYLLVVACFLLPVAVVASRIGQKRVFLFGLAVFTGGSVLCGFAPGIDWLIGFRLVQGVGAVCLAALMSSILITTFPKGELGRALGVVAAAATLGISLGPTLGGLLIFWAGWRAIFLVNLPIGITAFLLVAFSLPGRAASEDAAARLTPGSYFSVFRNPVLCAGLFGRFGAMLGNAAWLFLGPLLLEDVFHHSTAEAGILLAVSPMATALAAPVFGSLTDKFGTRRFCFAGIVIMLAGILAMSTLSASTGTWGYIAKVIIWGFGLGVFNAPNNTDTMQAAPPSKASAVSAWFSMSLMLGQIAGVAGASALFKEFAYHQSGLSGSIPIHQLPPAIVASAVAHSILFFAIPLAAMLLVNIGVAVSGTASRSVSEATG